MRRILLALAFVVGLAPSAAADDSRIVVPGGAIDFHIVTDSTTAITRGQGYVIIQWPANAPAPTPDPGPAPPPSPTPTPPPAPPPSPDAPTAKGTVWVIYLYDNSKETQADVDFRAKLAASTGLALLPARSYAVEAGSAEYAKYGPALNPPDRPTTPIALPALLYLDQVKDSPHSTVLKRTTRPQTVDEVIATAKQLQGK